MGSGKLPVRAHYEGEYDEEYQIVLNAFEECDIQLSSADEQRLSRLVRSWVSRKEDKKLIYGEKKRQDRVAELSSFESVHNQFESRLIACREDDHIRVALGMSASDYDSVFVSLDRVRAAIRCAQDNLYSVGKGVTLWLEQEIIIGMERFYYETTGKNAHSNFTKRNREHEEWHGEFHYIFWQTLVALGCDMPKEHRMKQLLSEPQTMTGKETLE
ncbi:hypothetical protein [Pseudodesulfovibrio piezophilus]|uniref:Uncharacterized protein n=1 Tax=Pseudodesulfovibrio piezophilus (strain DSM 21447 / JCM 15486 / C1TLV30) TaxID=1322246 RepID=M1WTS1_PSEP2|nr:hypothetical protein [Pseudodesulfovibrio piezophilus]CCH49852.1 protein of unknown function [Pseudodesulfovibrio piezophilus C1TLV30]